MDSLIVRGGHRLDGTLRASGSKNAALPIMAATLLTQGVCQLERIPVLRDIETMFTLLSSLGATVSRAADGGVRVDSNQACEVRAPYDLVKTMRASILVLGPLLARHGKAAVSFPGGCAIGSRPVDLHIQALEAMGATISIEGGYLVAEAPQGLVGTDFTFDVVTVGGTENAVMAASLATGTTVLERHGAMTGIMKSQIDWIPLSIGAVRPTQGKALAVMQVNGGSQSFNAVNQMRILGRWMRCVTIPNQSSVPKAFQQFDEDGRMKASPFYNRMVDVMEELMKFTFLTRGCSSYLTDRYSERVEAGQQLIDRVNSSS